MLGALEACGAQSKLLPGLKADGAALGRAAQANASLAQRFALLAWGNDEIAVRAICDRLRLPNEERELALAACGCRNAIRAAGAASPAQLLGLLKSADAFRRPDRWAALLEVGRFAEPEVDTARLRCAQAAAQGVDAAAIARAAPAPERIPERLDAAREQAIRRACD